jgi:hypothetical protein
MLASVKGVIRGGAVIPEKPITAPEGTLVEISFLLPNVPPELQAEFAAWDRIGDQSWAMIDEWEKEDA